MKFLDSETLYQTFNVFLVEISAKRDTYGYLNPILGKLGVMRDLCWWLIGKPMVDFLFAFIELSLLSVTVPELWGKMCTARLFSQGVDLFAVKFYLDRVIPHLPSWHQKTSDTGLPDSEVCISVFPHFDTIPECDRQMDGRRDLP